MLLACWWQNDRQGCMSIALLKKDPRNTTLCVSLHANSLVSFQANTTGWQWRFCQQYEDHAAKQCLKQLTLWLCIELCAMHDVEHVHMYYYHNYTKSIIFTYMYLNISHITWNRVSPKHFGYERMYCSFTFQFFACNVQVLSYGQSCAWQYIPERLGEHLFFLWEKKTK